MSAPIDVQATREGALFRVRAKPGARRTALSGVHGGALKVAVAAPPERGEANEALLRFLAERLALPLGALALSRGAASRDKSIVVRGADPVALAARLNALSTTDRP